MWMSKDHDKPQNDPMEGSESVLSFRGLNQRNNRSLYGDISRPRLHLLIKSAGLDLTNRRILTLNEARPRERAPSDCSIIWISTGGLYCKSIYALRTIPLSAGVSPPSSCADVGSFLRLLGLKKLLLHNIPHQRDHTDMKFISMPWHSRPLHGLNVSILSHPGSTGHDDRMSLLLASASLRLLFGQQ